jgi:hypothetical protein
LFSLDKWKLGAKASDGGWLERERALLESGRIAA